MEFKKYSSIENTYRIKTISDIKDYGLHYGDWCVTEKVHGANFSFWLDNQGVRCAKRTDFLSTGQKFFNWESVLDDYMPNLEALFPAVGELYNISDETLEIVLYGELFGGIYPHDEVERHPTAQKVQKGVYYCPDNDFYAFDMKVNGRYVSQPLFEEVMRTLGFNYAKSLKVGSFDECLAYPNQFQTTIPDFYHLPQIEDNVCEGVVIKPLDAKFFENGSRVILKNKNDKFKEKSEGKHPKHPKLPKPEIVLTGEQEKVLSEIRTYITDNRLNNVTSKIGEINDKMFGRVLGEFTKDILVDFGKDNNIMEEMDKKDKKVITKILSGDVALYLRQRFLNVIDGTL
jgi:Rnl2 family RNA ligase